MSWKQFNANFVEESGLSPWAEQRDVNICWINSSRFRRGPFYLRNWTEGDLEDVYTILEYATRLTRPKRRYKWGLSDGACLGHWLAQDEGSFDAVVCRSGPCQADVETEGPPVLIAGGEQEPEFMHRANLRAYEEYVAAGRAVDRVFLPCAHVWAPPGATPAEAERNKAKVNDDYFDWCQRA